MDKSLITQEDNECLWVKNLSSGVWIHNQKHFHVVCTSGEAGFGRLQSEQSKGGYLLAGKLELKKTLQ